MPRREIIAIPGELRWTLPRPKRRNWWHRSAQEAPAWPREAKSLHIDCGEREVDAWLDRSELMRALMLLRVEQGKILPGGWLFPGINPTVPVTTRQRNRAIHAAADTVKIDKRVSMPTARRATRP